MAWLPGCNVALGPSLLCISFRFDATATLSGGYLVLTDLLCQIKVPENRLSRLIMILEVFTLSTCSPLLVAAAVCPGLTEHLITIETNPGPRFLRIGDLFIEGTPDMLVLSEGESGQTRLELWNWDPDVGFGRSSWPTQEFVGIEAAVAGLFDDDPYPDIAIASTSDDGIYILPRQPAFFTPRAFYPTGLDPVPSGPGT